MDQVIKRTYLFKQVVYTKNRLKTIPGMATAFIESAEMTIGNAGPDSLYVS